MGQRMGNVPKAKGDSESIIPSTIAVKTDNMTADTLAKLEAFVKADGIRSIVTIASTALLEYTGIVDRGTINITPCYVKPPRTRSTIKLTPEEKAARNEANAEAKRRENFRALKLMEFVDGLVKSGKPLDNNALQAFDKWFSTQTLPEKKKRGPRKNGPVTTTKVAE